MSRLSPEPSIPAAGADPGGRKRAAHGARGAQTLAVTSAPATTPIADMIQAMLSGGISVKVVVLAERTAELARGGTDLVAERRRAFDRERKRRASAKARPAESQLLNWRHGQLIKNMIAKTTEGLIEVHPSVALLRPVPPSLGVVVERKREFSNCRNRALRQVLFVYACRLGQRRQLKLLPTTGCAGRATLPHPTPL